MTLLIIGVLLWSFMHLIPVRFIGLRASLLARMSEKTYKLVFALTMLVSIVLMVMGWKSTIPQPVYDLGDWTNKPAALLVFASFAFFAAASMPSNLKRFVRNPQLTGMILWAIGHLLVKGDSRSLVLFGGLLTWSVVTIIFSNQRDGPWKRPPAVAWSADMKVFVGAVVVYAVLVALHPWLFNVKAY